MSAYSEIQEAMDAAAAHRHPQRAMRVTLECGHFLLMPQIATVMGIGSMTGCRVCSPDEPGGDTARLVVNVEETGVLHDNWKPQTPFRSVGVGHGN